MQSRTLEQQAEELYLAERRLELARSASLFGIWEWNVDTNELIWDSYMFEMFDPKTWDATVQSFFNCLHPDDVPPVTKALEKGLTGAGYNYRFRVITKHGDLRIIHGKGDIISHNPNGSPHKMMGICIQESSCEL